MHDFTGQGTDEHYFRSLRQLKHQLVTPVARLLTAAGITANHVTASGCVLALVALTTRRLDILVAFMVLDLLIDLLDGSLALHQNTRGPAGTVFDAVHDALFVMTSAYALSAMGAVSMGVAYLYGANYGLMAVLVLNREVLGAQARVLVRPRLFVFGAAAFLLFFRVNFVHEIMLIAGILLTAFNAFNLSAIIGALQQKSVANQSHKN